MSRTPEQTTIVEGGLRYKSKEAGSPFGVSSYSGTSTMSCFLCGKHRNRSLLTKRKLFGTSHSVCSPSCKDIDEKIRLGT